MENTLFGRKAALLFATCIVSSAIIASLMTVWITNYEPKVAPKIQEIYSDGRTKELAEFGVDKVEIDRALSAGKAAFDLRLHRNEQTTTYRGVYPSTLKAVINVDPEGFARVEYLAPSSSEHHREYLREIGDFFLTESLRIAKRVAAFDGRVVAK